MSKEQTNVEMKDFMSSLEFVKKTMHGLPPNPPWQVVITMGKEKMPLSPTGMDERYSQTMPLILPLEF
jgi:hypothetical protein